jgi:hypothetical protein
LISGVIFIEFGKRADKTNSQASNSIFMAYNLISKASNFIFKPENFILKASNPDSGGIFADVRYLT